MFVISLIGQWISGWFEYRHVQQTHQQPIEPNGYLIQMARGTLENWQSEFLQLIWQVAGLSYLWYIGSPQSKEGDDRKEAKLDAILRQLDPQKADQLLRQLDAQYPRK